ncbi:sulfur oxidation protein SoxCD [Malaciobacter molluscorum LMG 25693]|uniref:Sulfur oxidation protein SoxCD n=1 Tax=Malaciobacter molluscorum LMG 25693 TaxID=870501 RepID=A0A2G1DJ91_9BACT|nr:c-type cytochrome [Malaciobacter molluscorum]AXX91622.1 sulfur oxidation protein SoxCD, diheme cytochrome c subunit [Malaciobacter molluscorum LMG 25693]PHO18583.1 sulfur oxidation protein SoxCD [Malaciobacter molluscorum LMG 25693]
MYKLENIKKHNALLKSVLCLFVVSGFLFANDNVAVDGGKKYPIKDGMYTKYHLNTQGYKEFNFGRKATKDEINAWNVDIKPDGEGLPKYDTKNGKVLLDEDGKPIIAQGSVELGEELYDEKCASCHGDFGSGGKGYPTLAGGSRNSLKFQRLNPADMNPNPEGPFKTIGTYWPYASTLFWYIKDSMPFTNPKTLTNSQTYALVAYLLSVNNIKINAKELDYEFILNKENFSKIKLPNEDGFYPNVDTPKNPKQGVENITKFLANADNYGTGKRCMKDCIKENVADLVLRIKHDLSKDANQPLSTKRDLPKLKADEKSSIGKTIYESKCAVCHGNEAIGAPVLGDKEAWANVVKKGMDKVYSNALNGVNAMPPKGGHMDISDENIKKTVDYMVESSK